jgi:2-desacetyl-2-hydroxyethyl bacteriochlorophyllide A dehydrogenase
LRYGAEPELPARERGISVKSVRARIVGEQHVEFEAIELPDEPSGANVLVKLERTIISAGTELSIYTGLEPDSRVPGAWCAYPWAPGYGGIGKVLAVGPAVQGIKPGQRVYGIFHHGAHALVDTSRQLCVPVPDELDSTTAAFARMGNVAMTAYRRATGGLGSGVAVFGLGLVGNLGGQFFVRAGFRVIGIDFAAHRRSLAEECGFAGTLDPAGLTSDALIEKVRELNHGARPRVVVDAVGESRLDEQGVFLAENNGEVIILGTPRAPYETDATRLLKHLHHRGIALIGALEWTVPLLKRQSPGVTTEANAEVILRMLADGSLKVGPLCSHVLPPAELNDAYQGLLHKKDQYIGVLLDWEHYPAPAPTWSQSDSR